MHSKHQALAASITARFGDTVVCLDTVPDGLTLEVEPSQLIEVATWLRDDAEAGFEMLVDLCGVDYLAYGQSEWDTHDATSSGFSRGVSREVIVPDPDEAYDPRRFAVVSHLLSIKNNMRVRLRTFCGADNPPIVPSLVGVWNSADWYEREAFDLYGILFDGHPDLRRILTDYGFIGHPFRKDFPLTGNVEVRYDPEQERVVYEPVEIEPRTLVPKVIRDDNRYDPALKDTGADG